MELPRGLPVAQEAGPWPAPGLRPPISRTGDSRPLLHPGQKVAQMSHRLVTGRERHIINLRAQSSTNLSDLEGKLKTQPSVVNLQTSPS